MLLPLMLLSTCRVVCVSTRLQAAEGLLSKDSLRRLDFACDASLSAPHKPISLWKEVRLAGTGWLHVVA
jgi:hypothetical protein